MAESDKKNNNIIIQELVYELKVKDVMNPKVITLPADTSMNKLRGILRDNRISGVPVVEKDKLIGVISIEDFIKWLTEGSPDIKVSERMTTDIKTLYGDAPLVQALTNIEQYGFGRFPVIDRESGKLIGVLTKGDIIEGLFHKLQINYKEEEIHHYRASHIFEDIVADKMAMTFGYKVVGKDMARAGTSASSLKKTLKRLGIHPKIIRRVSIAAYEAEMNLVIYTDGGEIKAVIDDKKILIEVTDKGPGIPDVEKALQPGYSTATDWVRELGFGAGMGLVNIKNSSDEMDLSSNVGQGTQLRIKISIHPSG